MGGGGPAKTGAAYNLMSTCATDTFSVSEAPNIPTLCGTLTGDHCMYPMKISATFKITIAIETKPSVTCGEKLPNMSPKSL